MKVYARIRECDLAKLAQIKQVLEDKMNATELRVVNNTEAGIFMVLARIEKESYLLAREELMLIDRKIYFNSYGILM